MRKEKRHGKKSMAFIADLRVFRNALNDGNEVLDCIAFSYIICSPCMKDAMQMYHQLWPLLLLKSKIILNYAHIYVY